MDWNKCIICQKSSQESLQCPGNSKRKDIGAGYVSFARLLEEFKSFGVKVTYCEIELSNTNQQLEHVLLENKACWHKSCRDNFNTTKLGRVKRKLRDQTSEEEAEGGTREEIISSPVKARRASTGQHNPHTLEQCFFCEEHDSSNLHSALTFEVDKKVRECAALLNDGRLIAKLTSGDMIAIEAKYHSKCLVSLYNRARSLKQQQVAEASNAEAVELSELAFAELVAYIEDVLEEDEPSLLTLSDLVKFYTSRLQHFLKAECGKVNATRLKERILEAFPSLTAHSEGREVHLALKDEIGVMLTRAKKMDLDATSLARAAHIVRREILNVKNTFNGSFPPDCQTNSVPASLLTLLGMIVKGPTTNVDPYESQACLSIAQLIVYNSIQRARPRPDATGSTHHLRARECPLPIYTALKVHGATRDRSLIDTFYNLGISISYDRLMSVSTETTNSVLDRYEREGVVCPSKLRGGLFTTSAADNIDHNPSSTSSHGSFHGTAISLVQHPSNEQLGTARDPDTFDATKPTVTKKIAQLPSSYSDLNPIALPVSDLRAPELPRGMSIPVSTRDDNSGIREEEDWLHNIEKLLSKETLGPKDFASWAAFRAEKSSLNGRNPAIISLLPMFVENAHSLAMIAHSMKVVKMAIQHVNPSQVPVIALDQPLFALAKQIQWSLVEYNEDRFVVMLGGLHIEMAAFKMLGKWVSGSGWSEAICNAGVATQGVAESFLTASHLTRTRRAHQVTAASLFVLMRTAYNDYVARMKENERPLSEEEWKKAVAEKCPQFRYWSSVLDLELACLRLVRAIREANFNMYVQSIRELLPWMFAMDHGNYARWLSVHYRDMCILPSKHPEVYKHFQEGCFTVYKTTRRFSAIALDHAHEQVNAGVKGDGGAVGLTENPAALRRWMVAGPETARMIEEFEGDSTATDKYDHYEQKKGVQNAFVKDVVNMISSFEELGNPFKEEGPHLMALHTKDIMDDSVIATVSNARKLGGDQFNTFLKERLVDRSKPVSDPLKKNNLPTLDALKKKNLSKDKAKVGVLKEDCSLFARLYIACQVRDGDLEDFFKFENQPWPPSLSDLGKLKGGQKANLLTCLPQSDQTASPATADAVILDGAVIVQMLKPGLSVTFEDFSNDVFLPYVLKHLETATRVDLVWDVYKDDSLKKALRSTKIPKDWKGFLRVDENKDELFKLLANKV